MYFFACLQELANQTEMIYKSQAPKRRMKRLKRIIYDDGEKGLTHQTRVERFTLVFIDSDDG